MTSVAHPPYDTSVGSFALLGSVVPRDAGVAAKLRASGAVRQNSVQPTVGFLKYRHRLSLAKHLFLNGHTSGEGYLMASLAVVVKHLILISLKPIPLVQAREVVFQPLSGLQLVSSMN